MMWGWPCLHVKSISEAYEYEYLIDIWKHVSETWCEDDPASKADPGGQDVGDQAGLPRLGGLQPALPPGSSFCEKV